MKKICFIIALALMLSVFTGAGALPSLTEPGNQDFDGYIVKLKEGPELRLFGDALSGLEEVYAEHNLYKADELSRVAALEKCGILEYAEPNSKVYLFGTVNDPYYQHQWNLTDIGVESAWEMGLYGEGVRVAVIDSGINASHEEFDGVNIVGGENLTNGSNDISDYNGHGTFISGVIAALSNNGKGIAGMAEKVTLIPIKCFDTTNEASVVDIINAIYKSVDSYSVDIINLSLGTANNHKSFKEATDYAESKNVLVISAVGNESNTRLFYPAAYDTVIGVGSTDRDGNHSTFSQINNSVFVSAPGEAIVGPDAGAYNSYLEGDGTSYAVPHVTALAAMALDYNPKLTPAQIRDIFAVSAIDLGSPGYDQYFGHGRIDVTNFLQELIKYGNGNTAPVAVERWYSAQMPVAQDSPALVVDMNDWFEDEEGGDLTFSVYSSTAVGEIGIDGSQLTYLPDATDADKNIRIVISANDGELTSEINAVLTVRVTSEDGSEEVLDAFVDLNGHWSRKYAAFAVSGGLMNGTDEARFAPDMALSRAMFVTILGRLSGEDITGYTHEFLDVPAGWYSDSVAWASAFGIVAGTQPGQFSPDLNVSRQQIAALLYRYAMLFDITSGEADPAVYYGYEDTDKVEEWAKDAMLWAVSNGIISGKSNTALDPGGNSTRAEAAAMLMRFVNTFIK